MKKCYAKINLALNVLNKNKPDGLHDLDMINMSVNLYDLISIQFLKDIDNDIKIICDDTNVPLDENNLVYKVIQKFKKVFSLNFSCVVKIKKHIPVFSGLGGGSSDASATLDILDRHFKTKMNIMQKRNFLQSITSDGPYMVTSSFARVKGVGEKISLINSKFKGKVLLIKPHSGCSTKEVYGTLDYKNMIHPNINKVEEALKQNDFDLLSKSLGNSLQNSACKLNADISDILDKMKACGFEIVCMTGSGSACFAISTSSKPYKKAKKNFNSLDYELLTIVKINNKKIY